MTPELIVLLQGPQSPCQQELDMVLEEISQMTFLNNKGSLENLYELKFPNCDKEGQYNLKQVSSIYTQSEQSPL